MFKMNVMNYVTEVERNSEGIKVIRKIPKKYDLIYDRIESMRQRKRLYRIRALRDLQYSNGVFVRKGDIGGLVKGEMNLSHEGSCWIDFDSTVYGDVRIEDNSYISRGSNIYSYCGKILIGSDTTISDSDVYSVSGDIKIQMTECSYYGSISHSSIRVKDTSLDIFGSMSISESKIITTLPSYIDGDRMTISKSSIGLFGTDEEYVEFKDVFRGVTVSNRKHDSFSNDYKKGIIITPSDCYPSYINKATISVHQDGLIKFNKKVFSLSKEKNTFEIR